MNPDGFSYGPTDPDLAVRKSRVLAAAASCPDAKRILRELFPDAFAEEFKPGDRVRDEKGNDWIVIKTDVAFAIRRYLSLGATGRFTVHVISLDNGNYNAFDPDGLRKI
jgi:hypothetical protein